MGPELRARQSKSARGPILLVAIFCLFTDAALPSRAQASDTIIYSYDALGRLVGTANTGGVNAGVTTSTSYDAAGNRTNQTVVGAGPATLAIGNASVTEGGTLSFTVTRSGNTAIAASASWA
ncbi:MAG: hypothetical protein KKH33_06835, partial [Alphaproteobacteria bacterium]|nr:hypothetical protein [Alphaproteobacteria bacterium]